MKLIKIALFLFLLGTASAENFFYARLTFYTNDPKYGRKSASGEFLKEGEHVAAERKFKFGTRFGIPSLEGVLGDGEFKVVDRGSHVQSRKASGGTLPVIDVYVSSSQKIRVMAATKKYHKVKVYVKG